MRHRGPFRFSSLPPPSRATQWSTPRASASETISLSMVDTVTFSFQGRGTWPSRIAGNEGAFARSGPPDWTRPTVAAASLLEEWVNVTVVE